jgi:hypothetical protein
MAINRPDGKPRKYDIRVVDQFYTYCSAVARANEHREAAAESQHVTKRHLWAALIVASVLCFYFVERVAQAMSLF